MLAISGLISTFILGKAALGDDDLVEGFQTLPSRCLVLLEDVDAGLLKRDSETSSQDKGGFSLSGLLNVLDVVVLSEGRVVFMTSNNIGRVEPLLFA